MIMLLLRALRAKQLAMTVDKGERIKYESSWELDPDKPWYHVMPRSSWLNDPNGPIWYKGRYHMYDLASRMFF